MESIVVLEDVRSVLNVGAIMRTCDGAGVKKLYLCGITPNGTHPKLKKTALGADEYMEWEYRKDIKELISELHLKGYTVYSVEQGVDSRNFLEMSYEGKSAFIFGNELTGVSQETLELSDETIHIPMFGKKNSLNVSTCVGIILYNTLK